MNTDLRSANQKLLNRLKQSQEEISQMIIAVKHSDLRVLDTVPLTSTIANQHKNVTFQQSEASPKKSSKFHHKVSNSGILKGKSSTSKRLPSPTRNVRSNTLKSPEKLKPVSQFLRSKMKEKNEENSCFSLGDSLLVSPGNYRPIRRSHAERRDLIQLSSKENQPVQVTFKTPETNRTARLSDAETRKTPPLLGYDWVAGVVENSEPDPDYSDSFVEEMKEFRKLNRTECHSSKHWNEMQRTPKTPIDTISPCKHYKMAQKTPDPSDTRDPRIINFTINKRLFPVPVDPNESIPPGSETSPRYIRVSIPKSSLLSPYRYRAMHRNTYTDGFDSLALPDHCLMGWQHTVSRMLNGRQNDNGLDLRSSLRPRENLINLQLKSGQAQIPVKNDLKNLSFLHESSFPHPV